MEDVSLNCPICHHKGKKIDTATVKSQLAVSLHRVSDYPYHFCEQPDCEVVYYDENGSLFTTSEVRERVYQKACDDDDMLICYCFYHTQGAVKAAILTHREQVIIDDIQSGIQAGKCACDWRNPQGSCCLGNIKKLIKNIGQGA